MTPADSAPLDEARPLLTRTRLAPSPTGALHLGNARTFLVNWALARQRGWRIVLRIDDLDGPRIKEGAARLASEDLDWLGLDWDEGPFAQRADLKPYRDALMRLGDAGAIYPCRCTRREIEAAALSAPHRDEHEQRYHGTCRPTQSVDYDPSVAGAAWRVRVPLGATTLLDEFAGVHQHDVAQTSGDFLVATKEGLPSYQLAVVVDDARQRISHIVRGDDLLASTHRQRLLMDLLGLTPPAEYYHLPLVVGEDGRRLAKRHGDTRVSVYRQLGVRPDRVVGLLAEWCGLGRRSEVSAVDFAAAFALAELPREPIVFSASDDAWLRGA